MLHNLVFSFVYLLLSNQLFVDHPEYETKVLLIDGQEVVVTHQVDSKFIGRYSGSKAGYLLLNMDGTGIYVHDEPGIMKKDCTPGAIDFEWGFLISDQGEIVKFDRPYGFSYPVIYKATGDIQFQGCSKSFLIDYILVKKNGVITISSSSDWIKE
ncbi:hypothetical protein ACFLU5_12285 [Bacteroidota bacterium]